jgi:putative endonuclease
VKRGRAGGADRRTDRQRLGDLGEARAAALLESLGLRVVARKHRTRLGEVDLVAEQGELLVFAEVRTRSRGAFGGPEETVDRAKQARVIAAARDFLARCPGPRAVRFDVIAVEAGELRHYPGAFDATLSSIF